MSIFGFGKKRDIKNVYSQLNRHHSCARVKAEDKFNYELIEELYEMSEDANTTVILVLSLSEAQLAKDMADQAPYDDIAKDFINAGERDKVNPRQLIEKEVDNYVANANAFVDYVTKMLESGKIVSNPSVSIYLANLLPGIIVDWTSYGLRLKTAFESIVKKNGACT